MRPSGDAGGDPEARSLPAMLAPGLRRGLIQLARRSKAREPIRRARRALAGFVGALKVKYRDIEVGLDLEPDPASPTTGDLELDLQELLEAVGQARRGAETGLLVIVDELQYVAEEEPGGPGRRVRGGRALPDLPSVRGLPVLPPGVGTTRLGRCRPIPDHPFGRRPSTRASSWCASTDSRLRRSATCGPWPNWTPDPTGRVTSRSSLAAR